MPSCSTALNPKNIKITFTEEDHKYVSVINGKTIEYISGTTFISKFFPEFDPTGAITRACARKRGLTVEAMRQEWRNKANESCIKGTFIHALCENILRNREYNDKSDTINRNLIEIAKKAANKLKLQTEILEPEKIVFNPELKVPIAGTIDILAKSKKDDTVLILDWKTNSKIETINEYNKYGFYPLEDIPAINLYEYAMQLSLYKYLLISGGYFPKDTKFKMALIHLSEKGSKIYPLNDYSDRIPKMIDVYSKENA